ncbi:MAG: glucosaminidase domain-containing protein [Candidatus Woesearchaeota archaeon]|jgi:flagellum-specific peptidoglycan hydrolase FlgJ
MRKRTFYSTLLPTLLAVLIGGYVSRSDIEKNPRPKQESVAQINCTTIDDVANTVVQEYAKKYSFPSQVSKYITENMCNALLVEQQRGIPAAGILAKAGSEHSFGKNAELISKANNHFGIKWNEQYNSKFPNCVNKETWEYNPQNKEIACFVKYDSARESYLHFGEFLATRNKDGVKPYTEVMKNLSTSVGFLRALAQSPYSTNPKEIELTLGILYNYHLEEIVSAVKEKTEKSEKSGKDTGQKDLSDSQNFYQQQLHTSQLLTTSAYSLGFKPGDLIVFELNTGVRCENTSVKFTYKQNKEKQKTVTVPTFEYNGKTYAQLGVGMEYSPQRAQIDLQTTCVEDEGTSRMVTDRYVIEIGGPTSGLQELPLTKSSTTLALPNGVDISGKITYPNKDVMYLEPASLIIRNTVFK